MGVMLQCNCVRTCSQSYMPVTTIVVALSLIVVAVDGYCVCLRCATCLPFLQKFTKKKAVVPTRGGAGPPELLISALSPNGGGDGTAALGSAVFFSLEGGDVTYSQNT